MYLLAATLRVKWLFEVTHALVLYSSHAAGPAICIQSSNSAYNNEKEHRSSYTQTTVAVVIDCRRLVSHR